MQALCLMPSITYFHKKMDQFGKDHDKEILRKVAEEARRKNKPHAVEMTQSNADMCTTSGDVSKHGKHQSANEGKKIVDSFSQIIITLISCMLNQPSQVYLTRNMRQFIPISSYHSSTSVVFQKVFGS